jgi:POT family proton-dependent oligopeptide transporter
VFALLSKPSKMVRLASLSGVLVFGILIFYLVSTGSSHNMISPEVFQSFNPLFIVFLTPLVMGVFAWLNKKGFEPSTPKKIGIGMLIAAIVYLILIIPSFGLVSPHALKGATVPDTSLVSPYWLINTYLIFTIAELCLSPMGLSFVSKVAPPRLQGLMQAGWLLATAFGNKLTSVGSFFWEKLEVWQVWLIFVVCCALSTAFIFSIMKRLEKATA